ncbi:endonuclease V [Mucilaginibacter pocheonensis]|uniref:Exodeoxyribonuclease-5/deoxyribonuclease V n=1 Tax=Mucilaginibacter pocheonensis TaxID=398050 RepID=A0ABU1TEW9_9SPHI|nr:endonuclease V [Mucilaginibacter pocheonensis]MDR6943918.1 exodeoxyribonuclease-5/deoxyribonuclease V [Mucilaginibacter pocheonensis]
MAFDTFYYDNRAQTICISFEQWESENILTTYVDTVSDVEDYSSGEFYKRELPCILHLITKIDLSFVRFIVIDGFVYLDDNNRLGLGGHLYHSLEKKIPVIGVAKTNFAAIQENKKSILRGESRKPIFVTSAGVNLEDASKYIKSMHGKFRIPKLLKELDTLTKIRSPYE